MTTSDHYSAGVRERVGSAGARGDPRVAARVARARAARASALGFPTTRDEEWRFTSVAPIADETFTLAGDGVADRRPTRSCAVPAAGRASAPSWCSSTAATRLRSRASARCRWARSVGEPLAMRRRGCDGETSEPHLARVAPVDRRAFVALNTAFLARRRVRPRCRLARWSRSRFTCCSSRSAEAHGPDHVASARAGRARATTARRDRRELRRAGTARGISPTPSPRSSLGENAVVDHYKVQHESTAAFHIGAMYVQAARERELSRRTRSASAARSSATTSIAVLDGEGGECTLNGLYSADGAAAGRQPHDDRSRDAALRQPRDLQGHSRGRARGVFNGKIIVRPDAQKTDAKQTNKALLLSDDAQINTKPQLEIFANDVKCTHGAAVGQLDEDAMFYLRSRGIGRRRGAAPADSRVRRRRLDRMPLEPVRAARRRGAAAPAAPAWLAAAA